MRAFALGFLSVFLLPVQAAEPQVGKVEVLEPLVVTATRTPTPSRDVGSDVTVITAEDIAQRQRMSVLDILRGVPGLNVVQSGGLGQQTSVFLRGANSNHTLVLIDGVEANDPSNPGGFFDFSILLVDNIERIEILRGPQSTLYGSDAIGGVISIITKKGRGKPHATARAQGGSFGTFKVMGGVSGGGELFNYSVTGSRLESSGISAADSRRGNSEEDGYHNTTVTSRLGLTPGSHFAFDFTLRYQDDYTEIDGSTVDAIGHFSPIDDPNAALNAQQLYTRGQGQLTAFDGQWEQILAVSFTKYHRVNQDQPDPNNPFPLPGTFDGEKVKVAWRNNLHFVKDHLFTFGIATEEESMEIESPSSNLPSKSARTTGYYLQDQWSRWDKLFITGGVRLDDHSRFGAQVTGRVTAALVFDRFGTKFRGSYGTGFKAPSLSQLFDDRFNNIVKGVKFEFSNPNLGPEKSESWDIGVEQFLWNKRLSLGVTYFDNDLTDLIQFQQVTPDKFQLINVAKAQVTGWEVVIALAPFEGLTLRGDYTEMQAKNKQTEEFLLRRPHHKAAFNANYQFLDKGNVHFQVIYVGNRQDVGNIRLSGYVLANLAVSYDFTENFQLFARVNNLWDEHYEEVFGFGTPGISGFGGVKFSL